MVPTVIKASSISDAWHQFLWLLMDGRDNSIPGVRSYKIDKGSYEGQCRIEFDFAMATIEFPGNRPFIPEFPPQLNLPPVADYENDPQEAIDKYMPYLASPDKQPNELYTYGERWQISWQYVIDYYKKYGWGTNRLIFEIGRPEDIFLYDKEDGHSPCLRLIQPRIYDGKLHFMIYFRSWDLWGGFPVNLGGIQQMKEIMVLEIGGGLEDGSLVVMSPGLHLYDHHEMVAYMRLQRSRNNA
jgi:thymidylate synthase